MSYGGRQKEALTHVKSVMARNGRRYFEADAEINWKIKGPVQWWNQAMF